MLDSGLSYDIIDVADRTRASELVVFTRDIATKLLARLSKNIIVFLELSSDGIFLFSI